MNSYYPRAQVGLLPPRSPLTPLEWPDGFIIHYVGANGMRQAPTLAESCATVRQIQASAFANANEGYSDIQYNFLIDPLGRIFEGRGWLYRSGANGSSNYNAHAWAVCYLGGPDTPLTQEARDGLLWLTQEGARRNGAVSYVKAHKDVYATSCPGPYVEPFCRTLNARLRDPVAPPPAPKPKVPPMYSPAKTLPPVVATLNRPTGGVWLLHDDFRVTYVGSSHWLHGGMIRDADRAAVVGRHASKLEPRPYNVIVDGERVLKHGYTIIATDGREYVPSTQT